MIPKFILGLTDAETVKLDFDNTAFKRVNYWASRALKKYGLKGYLILKSSNNNYHVVFDQIGTWTENMSIVARVSLHSNQRMLEKWFLMQCIKKESTLRVSPKEGKPSPRIVFRYGKEKSQVRDFLIYRKLIKRIIRKLTARAHIPSERN